MGGKQSKLRKELEALKTEAAAAAAKHKDEAETLRNEKRLLEFKLHALQEMTAKAQVEAEKATHFALESEEKMKALKWEMVRRLSVPSMPRPTTSAIVNPSEKPVNTLPVSWKLKDGVGLRRANTLMPVKPHPKLETDHSAPALMKRSPPKTKPEASDSVLPRTESNLAVETRVSRKTAPTSANEGKQEVARISNNDLNDTPVSTNKVATPAMQADLFAPVKRRTTQQPVPVVTADAKRVEKEEVSKESSKRTDSSKSESSHTSSSIGDEDDQPAAKSRGVHAAARDMGSAKNSDDLLELSDDEDE